MREIYMCHVRCIMMHMRRDCNWHIYKKIKYFLNDIKIEMREVHHYVASCCNYCGFPLSNKLMRIIIQQQCCYGNWKPIASTNHDHLKLSREHACRWPSWFCHNEWLRKSLMMNILLNSSSFIKSLSRVARKSFSTCQTVAESIKSQLDF